MLIRVERFVNLDVTLTWKFILDIIVHRGSNEVGGNCVEVRTKSTRLFIDVGMPLFDENKQPVDSHRIRRLSKEEFKNSTIPTTIHGLFNEDFEHHKSSKNLTSDIKVGGILLSHAHLDHCGLIPWTRSEIPVYCTSGTSKMMLAGSIFANQVMLPKTRFREIRSAVTLRVGDISITPISVDHSIYGALAFILFDGKQRVLYTGDLRMHGRKPGMMSAFITKARTSKLDYCVIEGTHIGLPNGCTADEFAIEKQLQDAIEKSTGLVLASLSAQHLDRLVGLIKACKRARRTLVVDFYAAFVLHLLATEVKLPSVTTDSSIRLFMPKSMKLKASSGKLAKLYERWKANEVSITDVRNDPSRYVKIFQASMFKADYSQSFPPNTSLIHSRWEGYLQDNSLSSIREAVQNCGGAIHSIHTSGHIFDFHLQELVSLIKPRQLIPIHTFEPDQFKRLCHATC